jgi:hypothetical protein
MGIFGELWRSPPVELAVLDLYKAKGFFSDYFLYRRSPCLKKFILKFNTLKLDTPYIENI